MRNQKKQKTKKQSVWRWKTLPLSSATKEVKQDEDWNKPTSPQAHKSASPQAHKPTSLQAHKPTLTCTHFSILPPFFKHSIFQTLYVQPGVRHRSCQQRLMHWNLWHRNVSIYLTPDDVIQPSEWPNPRVLNIYDAQISWLFLIHPDCKELLQISIKWEKYTMKELSLNLLDSFNPRSFRETLKHDYKEM